MPTYEYRCKSCGHDMEVQQAFTDDPLETCPECEGTLRKVYGNVGISFKGSGFYKTDSRGSSGSSSSGTSSSGSSGTETSSGSSSSGDSGSTSSSGDKATAATSSD